jgi:hypothetical protein
MLPCLYLNRLFTSSIRITIPFYDIQTSRLRTRNMNQLYVRVSIASANTQCWTSWCSSRISCVNPPTCLSSILKRITVISFLTITPRTHHSHLYAISHLVCLHNQRSWNGVGEQTKINLQNPSHLFTNRGLSNRSPRGGRRVYYHTVKNPTEKIPFVEQFNSPWWPWSG